MAVLALNGISRGFAVASVAACAFGAAMFASGMPWGVAVVPPAIVLGWTLRGRQRGEANADTIAASHVEVQAEAHTRTQQAMELAGVGTWHWDLRHRKVEYDPMCATMLGYAAGDVESSLSAWGKLVHPDDLAAAREAVDALLDGKVATYEVRVRLRAADGTWRPIFDRGRVTAWDADGRPTHAVGVHVPAGAEATSAVPSTRGRWVIVDDDDSVRTVIEAAARRAGLATTSFSDPRRAWAAIAEGAPVGIITDFDMPGMTGIQLAERVRAAGLGCPVLLVSGTESLALSECRTVDGLLSKPFTVASLQAWLGRHAPPSSRV